MTRAKTSFMKAGLIGLALCSSAAAFAQDNLPTPISGCLPAAEMMARLKAEDQKSVIVGDRITKTGDYRAINVVTMNRDGSRGYNIEGDAAIGQPTTKFCVRASLRDVRLHDVKNRNIPAELSNVKYLRTAFSNGIGLMLTARAEGDGNVPIIVDSSLSGLGGLNAIDISNGEPITLAVMRDVSYMPYAVERLKQGQQVAEPPANPKP
jgi:hypothetical protein